MYAAEIEHPLTPPGIQGRYNDPFVQQLASSSSRWGFYARRKVNIKKRHSSTSTTSWIRAPWKSHSRGTTCIHNVHTSPRGSWASSRGRDTCMCIHEHWRDVCHVYRCSCTSDIHVSLKNSYAITRSGLDLTPNGIWDRTTHARSRGKDSFSYLEPSFSCCYVFFSGPECFKFIPPGFP